MESRCLPCTSKIRVGLVVALGLVMSLGVPVPAAGAQGPIQISTAHGPGTVTVGATSSAAPTPVVGTPVWRSADGTSTITTSANSPTASTRVIGTPVSHAGGGSIATSVSPSVAPGVFVSPIIQATPTSRGPNSAAAPSDPPSFTVAVSCDAQASGVLVITNVGGDMPVPFTWRLSLDGVSLAQNSFQISPGQSFNISTAGLYGTLTLDVLDTTNAVVATGSADCVKPPPPPPPPPSFTVTGACSAHAIGAFTITDVGGNMTAPYTWRIDKQGARSRKPLATASFQLNGGQSLKVNSVGVYGTLTLSVLDTTNKVVATGSIRCREDGHDPRHH